MPTKMHLALDMDWTHQEGRWRNPGSWVGVNYPDITIYKEIVSMAERACLDLIFFGDRAGVDSTWRGTIDESVRWGTGFPRLDMSPFIAALSQLSKNIGFGLTYSTTYLPPYYVARLLNSLDHLTRGRIAFNVVTSTNRGGAANYGFDELMEHNSRYERMEEFIDVCKRLWASVEPGAMIWDRDSGVVADPSKVHQINHAGQFFKVRGPLQCPPSPQGSPVLIQAGGSPRGIKASANFADYVFGAGKNVKLKAKHRAELDRELLAQGRDPKKIGILWSTIVVIGETKEEAQRRLNDHMEQLPDEAVGAFCSASAGYDFSDLPQRFKLRELNEAIAATQASPVGFVQRMMVDVGGETEVTRKDFFDYARRFATGYDHTIAGTAAQIADHLEEEFVATGERGGFMMACPIASPRDILNIVDYLVPELQRRGRFRTSYEGATLRENLAIAA